MSSRNLVRVAVGGLLALGLWGAASAQSPPESAITVQDDTESKNGLIVDSQAVTAVIRQFHERIFNTPIQDLNLAYTIDFAISSNFLIGRSRSGEGFVANISYSTPLPPELWLPAEVVGEANGFPFSIEVCYATVASAKAESDATLLVIRHDTPDRTIASIVPLSDDIWDIVFLDPSYETTQQIYGRWRCAVNGLAFAAIGSGCLACLGGCPFPPNPVACVCALELCCWAIAKLTDLSINCGSFTPSGDTWGTIFDLVGVACGTSPGSFPQIP